MIFGQRLYSQHVPTAHYVIPAFRMKLPAYAIGPI